MSSALGFFHSLFFRCWHVIMSKKDGAVGVVQYDEKVKRRSLDDPLRYHRRSSIPFVDRKPAVRFIRNVQQSEPSESGPKTPANDDSSKHPILKKSNFPILVSSGSDSGEAGRESIGTTNDELDNCKNKTDLIMDKISRAERIARGSMDVLTFPTATRRVEALSRYQGSLTISICTLDILTSSSAYEKDKKKSRQIVSQLQPVVDCVQEMQNHANSFQSTAKTFLSRAKRRYNEWETLLKRNSEFKMENSKLNYPIYSHKRPPESVTLFEDTVEDPQGHSIDGYVRICRKYPEDQITVHCDTSEQADQFDPITFQDSSIETQAEVIKFVTKHGKELLGYSDAYLGQGLEMLVDKEIDEAFDVIQRKIKSIQYDDCFDPLCALELKNALGELVARKAELLNTAEQIVQHSKHIKRVTKMFLRFAKKSVKGSGDGCDCCLGGSSKFRLLQLLGLVSIEDIAISLPMTLEIAQDVFHMDPDSKESNVE